MIATFSAQMLYNTFSEAIAIPALPMHHAGGIRRVGKQTRGARLGLLEQTEYPTGRRSASSVVTCNAEARVGYWPEEYRIFAFYSSLALEVARGTILTAARA